MGCATCCCSGQERQRGALVQKSGKYRITYSGLGWKTINLVSELYITLLETCWPLVILAVCMAYAIIYVSFAGIWWSIGYYYGDFDNVGNVNHTTCLYGVHDFRGCLLFSIETLTSIGYGGLFPNPICPPNIPVVFMESFMGFWCETVLLGIIFVKLARPKGRRKTLMFSKHACVCKQNGQLQLRIRLGDIRKTHLLNASVTGMLVRKYTTNEGYVYPLYQLPVEFQAQGMENTACLIWPMTLNHTITESSPFWDIKPSDSRYELILFVEGTVDSTGETCQARTSFTPSEFLWGYEFNKIEYFDVEKSRWHVDFTSFDNVTACDKILSSACEINDDITDMDSFEKKFPDEMFETLEDERNSDCVESPDDEKRSNSSTKLESVSCSSGEGVFAVAARVEERNKKNVMNGTTVLCDEPITEIDESTKL